MRPKPSVTSSSSDASNWSARSAHMDFNLLVLARGPCGIGPYLLRDAALGRAHEPADVHHSVRRVILPDGALAGATDVSTHLVHNIHQRLTSALLDGFRLSATSCSSLLTREVDISPPTRGRTI